MQIVFKVSGSPTVAQVGDTNFQSHYAGINTAMAWQEVSPIVRQTTQEHILPFLGSAWYDDIAAKYNAGTTLSVKEAQALEYLQDSAANYAVYALIPQKGASLAALGVVQQNPDGGSNPSPQWATKSKRWEALNAADSALDRLLSFLLKNKADFPLWADSDAFAFKKASFFQEVKDLDDFINMKGSFRTFVSITPYLKRAEERVIRGILCDSLFASVVATPASAANAKLLPFIREAVVYSGAADALPHHRVVVDGDGFRVVTQMDGYDERKNMSNTVQANAISALLEHYKTSAARAITALVAFLEANLDEYPSYRDSSCREKPSKNSKTIYSGGENIGMIAIM